MLLAHFVAGTVAVQDVLAECLGLSSAKFITTDEFFGMSRFFWSRGRGDWGGVGGEGRWRQFFDR